MAGLMFPKPASRFNEKLAKVRTAAALERDTWAIVDARDGRCCRVCGKFCNPRAIGMLAKAHRHHLIYRSRGGDESSKNRITLCARHHSEIHHGKLRLSGDADVIGGVKVERPTDGVWRVVAWV